MRARFVLFLSLGIVACWGGRDESLNSGRDLNTAHPDAGEQAAPPLPAAPLRNVNVGTTGGEVVSRSYRARLMLSFPSQPGPSRASTHSLRLLPGEAP